MRRHTLGLAAAAMLAVAALVAPRVGAQGGLTYTSGIQVRNLSSSQAQIQIRFIDEASGNQVSGTTINATIAGNSDVTYFPLNTVPSGFRGSAVIESDQEIAAITNLVTPDFSYGGSATGLTGGSQNVGLPLIMRGNGGFNTFFSVQNTSDQDATVNISYRPGTAGTAATEAEFTLKPGASRTFDQSNKGALGATFVGSARIEADQPVAAMVGQVGTGAIKSLLLYDGFNAGSSNARAPLIAANNNGFFTGLSIQNVGSQRTTVTVQYGKNSAGGGFQPANEQLTLNAGQSGVLLQSGGQWTQQYVGSATITATGNQPIVAIVNQLRVGSSLGTAYEGVDPANLTTTATAPLVMANNGGYFTGIQCQNVGSQQTTITVTYSPNKQQGGATPAAETRTIAAGDSATILQSGPNFTGQYVGSASITASNNQNIACLVNQVSLEATGDRFLTYNGINY